MSRFCPNCGQPRLPAPADASQDSACPVCGAPAPARPTTPAPVLPPDSSQGQALHLQTQRRRTLTLAVAVALFLAALYWFLLQPSSPNSPARHLKNGIFGHRVTDAVERRTQQTSEDGESGAPPSGSPGNPRGANPGRAADGGPSTGSDQDPNADESGRRSGTGSSLPANVRNPEAPGPAHDAPPERSIGWLDRFFGRSPDTGPLRAGEGGTGTSTGAGKQQRAAVPPTNPPTAAESTQPEPSPLLPRELDSIPPEPPRTTNRPVPPSQATLNDNLERLLRQHNAGTGDLRISLMWSNHNDLDLHVVDPSETEIYYQRRRSGTGGLLDIDMNASPPLQSPAVENVYWPTRGAPAGRFRVYVNHFRQYDRVNETPFTIRILIRGRTTDFRGSIRFGEDKRLVHEFTLTPSSSP
jgi:hypothetical protein